MSHRVPLSQSKLRDPRKRRFIQCALLRLHITQTTFSKWGSFLTSCSNSEQYQTQHNSCEVLFIAAYVLHALFTSSLPSFLMQLRRCCSACWDVEGVFCDCAYCCRPCQTYRSPPHSHRWPSTGRTQSWRWWSSCRRRSWLPTGRRCRCHSHFRQWRSSSRAAQRWGHPACPAGVEGDYECVQ